MAVLDLWVAADESGIHDTAPLCLVMGFIASPRVWTLVEDEWRSVLAEFQVAHFHSKRFFKRDSAGNRLDEYRDWSETKAQDFLQSLLRIIEHRRIYPIGGAVDVADYNAYSYGERKFLSGGLFGRDLKPGKWVSSGAPSKPYYLSFQHLIVEATERTADGLTIHFMFDRQHVLQARAIQTFDEILRAAPPYLTKKLGKIGFGESPKEPALQVADLLCNSWYHYLTTPHDKSWDRRLAIDLLAEKRQGIKVFNVEGCEVILSQLPIEVRNALRAETDPQPRKSASSARGVSAVSPSERPTLVLG